MRRLVIAGSVVAFVVLLGAGCSDDDAAKTSNGPADAAAPGADSSASGSGTGGGDRIDLTGIDACTLIDETTVKSLTGVTEDFHAQQSDGGRRCFWGVTTPGISEYVELRVAPQTSLSGATFDLGQPCDTKPSSAAGDEADLTTCSGTSSGRQPKVQLRAYERGAIVTLLVNDAAPSESELGMVAKAVFSGLT